MTDSAARVVKFIGNYYIKIGGVRFGPGTSIKTNAEQRAKDINAALAPLLAAERGKALEEAARKFDPAFGSTWSNEYNPVDGRTHPDFIIRSLSKEAT